MSISFEIIINTIFYLGAIQGVILTVFLFNVKSNKISNRLLGILTSMWALLLLVFALQSYGLYSHYPHLLKTFFLLLFAWFPLLYLSVKYLVSDYQIFQKVDLLHFIPMGFVILMFSGFYFKPEGEKLDIVRNPEGYNHLADLISEEILTIQGVVYTILSLIIISTYKRNIVDFHSTINSKVLNGFRNGIILALIAWIIGIIATQLDRVELDIGVDLFLVVYLTFVVIIYLLSILAIRSPEVFKLTIGEGKHFKPKKKFEFPDTGKQLRKSPASAEDEINEEISSEDIALNKKLVAFMADQKPFLNPELNLQEMAEHLEVTRHQLSAVINQQQHMNFYEFVNFYRINEVKMLMQNPEYSNQNNYELAYEAGFNSKASFYRIFKQYTDQTPSEYRVVGSDSS